jgi:hypothetical protein
LELGQDGIKLAAKLNTKIICNCPNKTFSYLFRPASYLELYGKKSRGVKNTEELLIIDFIRLLLEQKGGLKVLGGICLVLGNIKLWRTRF